MSSDTDYGVGWDDGYASGYEDGKCAWMLAHEAVTARLLSDWAVDIDDEREPIWYRRFDELNVYEYATEPMTSAEVEIVRSVLASLQKETP